MRVTSLLGGMVLTLGALTAPNSSEARVDFFINVAPPPARVEVVPRARVGYVWAPGYWRWNGHRHIWVGGYWVHARPGWRWVPAHWSPNGPQWHYVPGYWTR